MCGWESWTTMKPSQWRTDAFELWCWRRFLRVPWTARRSSQSVLKEVTLNIHWRTDAEAETLILWPPDVWRMTHWKISWCWERLKAGGEGVDREWDGWMASLTVWTIVWANCESWWWTGMFGMLQSMGSYELDTTAWLNWTDGKNHHNSIK